MSLRSTRAGRCASSSASVSDRATTSTRACWRAISARIFPGNPAVIVQNQPGAGSLTNDQSALQRRAVRRHRDRRLVQRIADRAAAAARARALRVRPGSTTSAATTAKPRSPSVWHTTPVTSFDLPPGPRQVVVGAQAPGFDASSTIRCSATACSDSSSRSSPGTRAPP